MRRLVATADITGDGTIDIEEFRNIFKDPGLQKWFASMEFVPKDVDPLFHLMDDGDGKLSADEVIKGVAHLKGTARNIDLHILVHEYKQFRNDFRLFQAEVEKYLKAPGEHTI